MRSDDVDVLQLLVNAAMGWQTTANAQGVNVDILKVSINGKPVTLAWNSVTLIWDITAE